MDKAQAIEAAKKRLAIQAAKARLQGMDPAAKSYGSIEEMHPDISATDRFLFQMFDDDPEGAIQKLKQEHPDLNFRIKDGRAQVIKKGDKVWRFIDPDKQIDPIGDPMGALKDMFGPTGIKEGLMDVTDVAYPLASGVVETGAGIGGALLGAPAGPPGMIGGAMAGAGTAGVAMDAGRQGLGKALGYNQKDFDMGKALTSGAVSAVVPGVLGPGLKAGGKQALKAAAKDPRNLDWMGGLLGKTKGTIASGTGSMLSGRPMQELKDMSRNLDYIRRAEENTDITANVLGEFGAKVRDASKKNVRAKGAPLGDKMFDDIYLETDPILKPLRELRNEFMESALAAEGREGAKIHTKNAERAIDLIDDVLEKEGTILQGPKAIKAFQDSINGLQQRTTKVFGQTDDPVKKAIHDRSKFAMTNFNSTLAKQGDVGAEYVKRKADYARALDMDAYASKLFKDGEKSEATIRALGAKSPTKTFRDKEVNVLLDELGVPLDETTKLAKLQQVYAQPSKQPVSFAGTTSTSMSNANQELGGAAAYQLAPEGQKNIASRLGRFAMSKAGSPWAMRKSAEALEKVGNAKNFVNKIPSGPMDVNRLGLNTWLNMYNDQ